MKVIFLPTGERYEAMVVKTRDNGNHDIVVAKNGTPVGNVEARHLEFPEVQNA